MKKISELFNVTGYGAVVTGGASGIGLALTEALAGIASVSGGIPTPSGR